jgi:hypothetical protein
VLSAATAMDVGWSFFVPAAIQLQHNYISTRSPELIL